MLEGRKTDNFSMRIFLETIENIVGPHGLKSVLNYAHLEKYIDDFPLSNHRVEIPLEDLQILCRSLLELFGRKGIRSLQLRVGRQIISRSLEKHPLLLKMILILRFLMPEPRRTWIGLEKLIKAVEKSYPPLLESQEPQFELREEEDCFLIIYRDNWESEDVMSQSPVCNVTVGSIEAYVEWAAGHAHDATEIECRAMGSPVDVFRISKSYKEEGKMIEKRALDSPFPQKKYI
ncbi:MAG: hypothetical protein AYK18_10480 [Theionarchaea archaeon DG-70]|nr:MAG: hypothetical protein AYK18_10480 [Theionarchaea archaeon DG-70]